MPGFPAKLGPFVGGLNTLDDGSTIADQELQECINFDVNPLGALVSRPPVTAVGGPTVWAGGNVLALGYFRFATGNYLIVSNATGTYYRLGSGGWVTIAANLLSTSAVQYGDNVFILAANGSSVGSGKWNPSAGFSTIISMPKGQKIIIYKERGLIAAGETAPLNSSRLYLSKVTDLTDWTSPLGVTATVDISPGDGQHLVDIVVYNDVVMCFKEDSTYSFSYATLAANAVVRNISPTIGVPTHHCAVVFENQLYAYHNGKVYELIKSIFTPINVKVPFLYDATSPGTFVYPVFLTLFGDRLLVRFYNRVYAFGLRTRTWSRYTSTFYVGPLVAEPINAVNSVLPRFFGGSCISNDNQIFTIQDGFDNIATESFTCTVITKNYDMSHQIRVGRYFITQSHKFKRQYYWDVLVQTGNDVVGTAQPIVNQTSVTWGQLATYQWGALNTWGNPLIAPAVVTKDVVVGTPNFQRLIRFPKALRFRSINYRIDMPTTGKLSEGPVKFFEIIAMIATKAGVPAEVN